MSNWLSLFPLGEPLFPGVRLELQIFEQRYLKLVRASLREDTTFGIPSVQNDSETGVSAAIYNYGTEVKIVDWTQLPNGLLGITVLGGRRFSVGEQVIDPDGLRSAQIEYLDKEVSVPITEEMSGLVEIYQELLFHSHIARRLPGIENIDASGLGFGLAQVLPMDKNDRINCLSCLNSLERIDFLVGHIEGLANSPENDL